jgi:2-keto-3-deoxy-L-rhamnonate aldolase RhmA
MKDKLLRGELLLGMFLSEIAAPNLIRLMRASGMDFVVIDCEHGYFDYSQVASIAAVANGTGFPVIVRIPGIQREHIQKYLDAGADGLLVPMLETQEQAKELVRLAKYAPEGARGISTMRPHSEYAPGELKAYTQAANNRVMLFAQIETRKAVGNIAEIAAVEGLDGIFVGPNDLACDMEHMGRFNTERMDSAVQQVIEAARVHGLPSGMIASDPEYLRKWAAKGMTIFSCDSELGLLKKGILEMKKQVLA